MKRNAIAVATLGAMASVALVGLACEVSSLKKEIASLQRAHTRCSLQSTIYQAEHDPVFARSLVEWDTVPEIEKEVEEDTAIFPETCPQNQAGPCQTRGETRFGYLKRLHAAIDGIVPRFQIKEQR